MAYTPQEIKYSLKTNNDTIDITPPCDFENNPYETIKYYYSQGIKLTKQEKEIIEQLKKHMDG